MAFVAGVVAIAGFAGRYHGFGALARAGCEASIDQLQRGPAIIPIAGPLISSRVLPLVTDLPAHFLP